MKGCNSVERDVMGDMYRDGAKFTPTSERSKQIRMEQGHVEMIGICQLSKKVQCERCYKSE